MVNGTVLDEAHADNLHAFIDATKEYKQPRLQSGLLPGRG
jgi:hypothetical protein